VGEQRALGLAVVTTASGRGRQASEGGCAHVGAAVLEQRAEQPLRFGGGASAAGDTAHGGRGVGGHGGAGVAEHRSELWNVGRVPSPGQAPRSVGAHPCVEVVEQLAQGRARGGAIGERLGGLAAIADVGRGGEPLDRGVWCVLHHAAEALEQGVAHGAVAGGEQRLGATGGVGRRGAGEGASDGGGEGGAILLLRRADALEESDQRRVAGRRAEGSASVCAHDGALVVEGGKQGGVLAGRAERAERVDGGEPQRGAL
jgi:hypothetical protein